MDQRSITILRLGESETKRLLDAGLCTIDQLRAAVEDRSLRKVNGFGGRDGLDSVANALSRLDSEDATRAKPSGDPDSAPPEPTLALPAPTAPPGPHTVQPAQAVPQMTQTVKQDFHLHTAPATFPSQDGGEGELNRWTWKRVGILGLVGAIVAALIVGAATLGAPVVTWALKKWEKAAEKEKATKAIADDSQKPPAPAPRNDEAEGGVAQPVPTPKGKSPVTPEAPEPTIKLSGKPYNEKQKTSLDWLRLALKDPDEVFNAKGRDYEGKPIEDWICRFESDSGKPKSPKEGREFYVVFDDSFRAVCYLKPGDEGKELEHLKPGDQITIAKAWPRAITKEKVADNSTGKVILKPQGWFRLLNCELKTPL